ncbi:hypothetical protein Hanom_Chr06g00540461 [Helianthus anomalus]
MPPPSCNYREWKAQMECLLDCHDMLGYIDGRHNRRTPRKKMIIQKGRLLILGPSIGNWKGQIC